MNEYSIIEQAHANAIIPASVAASNRHNWFALLHCRSDSWSTSMILSFIGIIPILALTFSGIDLHNAFKDPVHPYRIDELAISRGHKYMTLVYQIDNHCKRLLWLAPDRTIKTLLGFFREFGKERPAGLKFVCSDMWRAYLNVVRPSQPLQNPTHEAPHQNASRA